MWWEYCYDCTIGAESEIKFNILSFYRDVPLSQSHSVRTTGWALDMLKIEHDLDVLMDYTDPTLRDFKDVYNLSTSAFGLTGGIGGLWSLTDRVSLDFDMWLSLLYVSTEGKYKFIEIEPSGACSTFLDCWVFKWNRDTIIPMLDLALRLNYSLRDNLVLFAGYNICGL